MGILRLLLVLLVAALQGVLAASPPPRTSPLAKSIPTKPLVVGIGQKTALDTQNLVLLESGKSGTLCQVEVDVKDPLYQSVGQIYPKVSWLRAAADTA